MSFPPPPPPEDQPRYPVHPTGAAPFGGYTTHGQYPTQRQGSNGFAVASLVLGIVGLVACCLWVPQLLAVIFGAIALSQLKSNPTQQGRGMAIAGLVMGMLSFAIIILVLAIGEFHYSVNY